MKRASYREGVAWIAVNDEWTTVRSEYVARIPAVSDWLHHLRMSRKAHGAELAELLVATSCVNATEADRYLKVLEEAEWIIRRPKPTPTRDQLCLGWAGTWPPWNALNSYPALHEWTMGPNFDHMVAG